MSYAERAYFENDHCHHVGVWQERTWAAQRKARAFKALDRRSRPR